MAQPPEELLQIWIGADAGFSSHWGVCQSGQPRLSVANIMKQRDWIERFELMRWMLRLVKARLDACLGFATGGSPIPVYDALADAGARGDVSFANVRTFNLDGY